MLDWFMLVGLKFEITGDNQHVL